MATRKEKWFHMAFRSEIWTWRNISGRRNYYIIFVSQWSIGFRISLGSATSPKLVNKCCFQAKLMFQACKKTLFPSAAPIQSLSVVCSLVSAHDGGWSWGIIVLFWALEFLTCEIYLITIARNGGSTTSWYYLSFVNDFDEQRYSHATQASHHQNQR